MVFLIALLVFLLILGSNWWFGAWNCLLNLMNFFLAALIASSFYENVASQIVGMDSTYVNIADFVAVWLVFALSFVVLRLLTDFLSRYQLKLEPWLDYVGRGVFSFWLACGFLCFTFFTLHMAPLPPDSFQSDPTTRALVFGPDRFWLSFIQSRSRGALSEAKQSSFFPSYALPEHPDDEGLGSRVFDPKSTFIFNNHAKRKSISESEYLRAVN